MPKQEIFLRESIGPVTVEVIKTYDPAYAGEVFRAMEQGAKAALLEVLGVNKKYSPEDIPSSEGPTFDNFLWDELSECALEDVREYPRKYSFFVVRVSKNGDVEDLFISPDWPGAEAFARAQLAVLQ